MKLMIVSTPVAMMTTMRIMMMIMTAMNTTVMSSRCLALAKKAIHHYLQYQEGHSSE